MRKITPISASEISRIKVPRLEVVTTRPSHSKRSTASRTGPRLSWTFHLRHAANLHLDFDAARVAAGFATRLVILSLDPPGERHSPQPRWPPARLAGRRLLLKLQ